MQTQVSSKLIFWDFNISLVGHKLDKVGGKAKKSISSLKLNKDKKNLDSVPEGKELDNDNPNLDPGVNSDDEDNIDDIFKVNVDFGNDILTILYSRKFPEVAAHWV